MNNDDFLVLTAYGSATVSFPEGEGPIVMKGEPAAIDILQREFSRMTNTKGMAVTVGTATDLDLMEAARRPDALIQVIPPAGYVEDEQDGEPGDAEGAGLVVLDAAGDDRQALRAVVASSGASIAERLAAARGLLAMASAGPDHAALWAALPTEKRADALAQASPDYMTPALGKPNGKARKTADLPWGEVPERENKTFQAYVRLFAKAMQPRRPQLPTPVVPMPSRPAPAQPEPPLEGPEATIGGIKFVAVRVQGRRPYWGADNTLTGERFPRGGETKAKLWSEMQRTYKAIGHERWVEEFGVTAGSAQAGADAVRPGDVFAAPTGEAVTVMRVLPGGKAEVRIQGARMRLGDFAVADLKAWPKIGRADFADGMYTTPESLIEVARDSATKTKAP
jgi:hypothetical protein